MPRLPRHAARRRAPRPIDLPGVQGPRRALAQPGLLLAVGAVPALRRHRPDRRARLPDLPRPRPRRPHASATPCASRPASRTASSIRLPGKGGDGRRRRPGRRPASCSSTSAPRRSSSGAATTSWSTVPVTFRRPRWAPRSRCRRRDRERVKREGARPAPATASCCASRAAAPPSAAPATSRATCSCGSTSQVPEEALARSSARRSRSSRPSTASARHPPRRCSRWRGPTRRPST